MPKAVGKGWGRGSVPPGEALLPEDSLQMCTCMYTPHACTDRRARTPHTHWCAPRTQTQTSAWTHAHTQTCIRTQTTVHTRVGRLSIIVGT